MSEELSLDLIKSYISDFKYPHLEGFDIKAIRFLLVQIAEIEKVIANWPTESDPIGALAKIKKILKEKP